MFNIVVELRTLFVVFVFSLYLTIYSSDSSEEFFYAIIFIGGQYYDTIE